MPEQCVELFDPYEDPQQRSGDRVARHLVILDAAREWAKWSAGAPPAAFRGPLGPFGTLTLPPTFALERRCAARTINLPRDSQTREPELARVVRDTTGIPLSAFLYISH